MAYRFFICGLTVMSLAIPLSGARADSQLQTEVSVQNNASAQTRYDQGMRLYAYSDRRSEAIEYIQSAAQQGYAPAQVMMGELLSLGDATQTDYKSAADWFLKAAEQGNAKAQFAIGSLYSYGLGVQQSDAKARHYMQRVADNKGADEKIRQLAQQRLYSVNRFIADGD
ncbi:MAG: hypothetical protein CMI02_07045 [Oceanospirillaceae bacterium]|nr:hypothetical protein [Oceanospirillaceae bacterium]MBT11773.1 hypothetical protein [Oceanospirillaceae bacterium]|tara:strand:+ start:57741 stop:58247 length:507 start_codon:yes stop_codon:yes gene_type:complete